MIVKQIDANKTWKETQVFLEKRGFTLFLNTGFRYKKGGPRGFTQSDWHLAQGPRSYFESGGLTSDSKWGGWKLFFLSNSL